MKRLLPWLALAIVSCGPPPDLLADAKKPTYYGTWRAGTSAADYKIIEIFKDNSISFFGTRNNMIAPIDLKGDEMVVKADKATTKDPNFTSDPAFPNDRFPFHLKRISDTKIEMTDDSGRFLGVKTPITLEKVTSDEAEQTNAQIMQRASQGG